MTSPKSVVRVSPGETRRFNVPGRLHFPKGEIPLVFSEKDRILGSAIAKIRVTDYQHENQNGSTRTSGEYVVEARLDCASINATHLGAYLRNPIHDPKPRRRFRI